MPFTRSCFAPLTFVAGVLATLAAGCATTSGPTAENASVAGAGVNAPSPFRGLQKGMSGDQIREMFGEPDSIAPFPSQEVVSEVWTYSRPVGSTTTQEVTGTSDTVYVDPITGETKMVPQPEYRTVVLNIEDTVELLMIGGQLQEWKGRRNQSRNYN